ncbi:XrtA system polysaccharide chain length determinant [Zooshikella sp. RANM57]|uniref:XrtA system polysaccharide chain length determinant n=1 Tax=Zooshikella sp. RANM57 TaxID=3425863 RepID=UPI003D6FB21A
MQDIIGLVIFYLREVWLRRWIVLLIAAVICVIGWAAVFMLPDQYRATARFYVDTQTLLKPLLRGLTVQTNMDNQVNLMVRTLLSRPNIKKIAEMADLDFDLDETNPEALDSLVDRLRKEIEIKGSQRENVYSIEYQSSDHASAKRVVQAVLDVLKEGSLGETREESIKAQKFIDQQIREYEQRLVQGENRLKEFKRKYAGMMPSSEGDYFQRLETAKSQYESAKLELEELKNKLDSLQKQLKGEEPGFGMGSNSRALGFASSYDARIDNLEAQLDNLLLKYTAQHPDVVAAREQLAMLKSKRASEIAALKQKSAGSDSSPLEGNRVYQQLKIQVSELEADVSAKQVRVDSYKEKVDELNKLVNTIPEIEAELIALNRDYQVTKRKYEDLLSRRESAQISRRASQSTDDVQFKEIDPPHVPAEPSGPNRPLLSSAIFVLALGLSAGFTIFIAMLGPTFTNKKILADVTGLPVLGSVTYLVSEGEQRVYRNHTMVYMGLWAALVVSFVLVLVIQMNILSS